MARDRTGQKTTATKAERTHAKAVDTAIRHGDRPQDSRRQDRTFAHLHREGERHDRRMGWR